MTYNVFGYSDFNVKISFKKLAPDSHSVVNSNIGVRCCTAIVIATPSSGITYNFKNKKK